MRRLPWIAFGVALASWLLSSGIVGPGERFSLVRTLSLAESFRLWTGHLVHFNAAHLRGDVLAFALWAALVEWRSRRLLVAMVGVGAPFLSLALLWLHPTLDEYRGLSALDCGLVVALSLLYGTQHRRLCSLVLGLFAAKCGYELVTGHALLAPDLGSGVRLLPLSHVLGAVLGGVCFWWASENRAVNVAILRGLKSFRQEGNN